MRGAGGDNVAVARLHRDFIKARGHGVHALLDDHLFPLLARRGALEAEMESDVWLLVQLF